MNRNRTGRTPLRTATVLIGAAGLMVLAGCQGHGKYTEEGVTLGKQKMAFAKAGTEYQMAQQQFFAGELDKALKTINRSLKITEEVPKAHVLKGRILLEMGDLTNAYPSFVKASELDEEAAEPHYYLGILHERFREPEIALERYQKAAEMDPSNPQYVVASAEMLMQMQRLDEAETMLTKQQEQFAYDAAIRQTLGHVKMLKSDYAAAVDYFNEALLLSPDDTIILEDLVQAQVAAEQYAEAEFNVGRLMDASEDERRDLMHLRARCLIALDRPVEARSLLLQLVESKEGGKDLPAWLELGNVAYVLKDRKRLDQASSRVINLAPERYEGYFLRAAYFRAKGDPQKALSSVDTAIQRAGMSHVAAGPLMLRGMILHDIGQREQAMQAFARAVQLDPSNQRTRDLYEALAHANGQVIAGADQPEAP